MCGNKECVVKPQPNALSLYIHRQTEFRAEVNTLPRGTGFLFLKDVPPKAEGGVGREGRPKDRVITKPLQ